MTQKRGENETCPQENPNPEVDKAQPRTDCPLDRVDSARPTPSPRKETLAWMLPDVPLTDVAILWDTGSGVFGTWPYYDGSQNFQDTGGVVSNGSVAGLTVNVAICAAVLDLNTTLTAPSYGTSNESNSIWVTPGPPFGLVVLYSGETNVLPGWGLTAGITFVVDSMEAW